MGPLGWPTGLPGQLLNSSPLGTPSGSILRAPDVHSYLPVFFSNKKQPLNTQFYFCSALIKCPPLNFNPMISNPSFQNRRRKKKANGKMAPRMQHSNSNFCRLVARRCERQWLCHHALTPSAGSRSRTHRRSIGTAGQEHSPD